MLKAWMEILPLFIVKWIALKICERVDYRYEGKVSREFVTARPDVLIKVPDNVL